MDQCWLLAQPGLPVHSKHVSSVSVASSALGDMTVGRQQRNSWMTGIGMHMTGIGMHMTGIGMHMSEIGISTLSAIAAGLNASVTFSFLDARQVLHNTGQYQLQYATCLQRGQAQGCNLQRWRESLLGGGGLRAVEWVTPGQLAAKGFYSAWKCQLRPLTCNIVMSTIGLNVGQNLASLGYR